MNELSEKKIHIIGIGGTGMAPIAVVLNETGTAVTGSDRSDSVYTDELRARGIDVMVPQSEDNIKDPDMVFYSSAIHDDNPELAEARRRGIPVLKRREFLPLLLEDRKTIAIAGSHGKSTTTSMMAWVLSVLGKEPGFIVGSHMKDFGKTASAGKSEWFVIEADEYDNMFLGITPFTAALTKVEYDHPDCFPTPESYLTAFQKFLNNTCETGFVLLNADDPLQSELTVQKNIKVFRYGLENSSDFRAEALKIGSNGCYSYQMTSGNQSTAVKLSIPGKHNVYNSLLVMSFCAIQGFDLKRAAEALEGFHGISRRFELVDDWNDIKIIDDYAHHPTEICATLRAAREYFPGRRIWAIWQPHTYSRTKSLIRDFITAFKDADELIITDIYAARESYTDFGIENVIEEMQHPSFRHLASNDEVAEYLAENLRPGDVVVTLSAGDANRAAPKAMEKIKHAAH